MANHNNNRTSPSSDRFRQVYCLPFPQFYQHHPEYTLRRFFDSLRYLGSESCLFVIIVWRLPKGKPIRSAVYPLPEVYSSSQTAAIHGRDESTEGMKFHWKHPRRGWRSSAIVDEHLCYLPENVCYCCSGSVALLLQWQWAIQFGILS